MLNIARRFFRISFLSRLPACFFFLSLGIRGSAWGITCGTTKTVKQSGIGVDCSSIQQCVNLIPASALTGNYCIDIQDSATYAEQVTVQGKNPNNFQIAIGALSGSNTPVVSPPASSTAAFQILNASVTISGVRVQPANAIPYGVQASSAYVTISSVNVDSGGKITQAGIRLSGYTTVSYSSVTVQNAYGIQAAGSLNAISFSTMTANGGTTKYSLYLNGAAATTVAGCYLNNPSNSAAWLDAGSISNTISQSTVTGAGNANAAFQLNGTSNTVTASYIFYGANPISAMNVAGTYNTVSLSTMVSNGTQADALSFNAGAQYNLVSGNYMFSTGGGPTIFLGNSATSFNTITQSTASNDTGYACQFGGGVTSNTITQDYFYTSANNSTVVYFANAVYYNTISWSTMVAVGNGSNAINSGTFQDVNYNLMTHDMMTASGNTGPAVDIANGNSGAYNTISFSTMIAANDAGMFLSPSSMTISNCYIQGSTAVWLSNSTGTVLNSNILVGNGANGSGVWLDNAFNVNLSISSNVILGGSQGAGIYLDVNNAGAIYLTTNTILAGARYGIYIATQMSGTQIYVTSNAIVPTLSATVNTYGIYLNGLQSGATIQDNAISYRTSGGAAAQLYYGLYAQSAKGLNIDHNRINNPGMVNAGSPVSVYFAGTQQTAFKFNDVNSVGPPAGLISAYLLQAAGSTITIRDNVFASSFTISGSSASLKADAASGFDSDYNTWYDYNASPTLAWGGASYPFSGGWAGKDSNSVAANPLWNNASAGVDDFHPRSQTGRYNPTTQSFAQDCQHSPSIDKADPAEAFSLEPSPNGGRANQGSYGNTPQASETAQIAPPASIGATALVGQITISWTAPTGTQGCTSSYVDHYELAYSSITQGGPYTSLTNVSSNTLAFVHTGLISKTTYFYNVVTSDALLNKSIPAQTFAVTPDSVPPAAVTNLSAAMGSAVGQVSLSWMFPGDDNGTTTLPAGSQYAIQSTTNNATVVWSTANAQVTISTGNVPVGSLQNTVLSNLNQSSTYYFSLWTAHPGPVWSAQSNIASSPSRQAGPSVASISPADGSACVAWSTAVVVTFNKVVQYASFIGGFKLTLVADNLGNSTNTVIAGTINPAVSTNSYRFTPSAALAANGTYSVSVSTQVSDAQGNPLMLGATAQFTTLMSRASANAVVLPGLGASVTAPAGALPADGCIRASTTSVSGNVTAANWKLVANSGDPYRVPIAGTIVDLKAYDGTGNVQSGGFGTPMTVTIPYPDAGNRGIVDGTNPPVKANTLGVWWLDDANALWVRLPGSSVDTANKQVAAQTAHFTTFALIGQSATDLGGAYAFPVPFRSSQGHTKITFTGLGQNTRIRIYTVTGERVVELQSASPNGQLDWYVTNSEGRPVSSGVYVYLIDDGRNTTTGKLVIIR